MASCEEQTSLHVPKNSTEGKSTTTELASEEVVSSSSSSDTERKLTTKEKLALKKKLKCQRKQERQAQEESEKNAFSIDSKSDKLRTSSDVIKRIKWDSTLNLDHFAVGYLDRFLGVIEEPFDTFNWEDEYTSLDPEDDEELAIPKHRIQYFKYKGEIVWDRKIRLDNIFGSCGGKKFEEVLQEEEDKRRRDTETEVKAVATEVQSKE